MTNRYITQTEYLIVAAALDAIVRSGMDLETARASLKAKRK
jgi:hypothetical protein